MGLGLVTVLDQLRVQRVVALGDGAGGSIIARYSTVHCSTVQYSTVQHPHQVRDVSPSQGARCHPHQHLSFQWSLRFER